MRISDWSSDVCSSDLDLVVGHDAAPPRQFDPVFHHAAPVEHDALGLCRAARGIEDEGRVVNARPGDRCGEIVRGYVAAAGQEIGRSEEHTSELQSLMRTSYAVFCLKNKTQPTKLHTTTHNTRQICISY